jgi:WD40 repeat protein
VAVADDGDRYAAGTETGAVSLGDIGMGQVEIRAHSGRVRGVAFTSGHSHLVTAGEDGLVLLWDTANPERVMLWARTGLREPVVVRSGGGPVAAVACSQWNDVFAYASADGTVRLHRVSDAAPVAVFRHGTPVRALAFAAREALLASAGDDGTVKLWDWSPYTEWKSLRPRATWTAHKGRVSALAFSPDGRTVGSGGVDGAVGFWESAAGAGRASPGGADIACVAFSRDGSAALSVASDGLARRFRPDPAGNWGAGPAPEAVRLQEGSPCRFAVSADLALVATIVDNPKTGRPRLWDIPSGRERTGFPEVADAGYEIVLSPDGREVIVGLDSRHARVLSTADGREIIRLASGFPPPGAAVYLPDGKSIAAWSIDRLAKVVDAGSGRETRRLRVSSRYFGFSADGAWLAAAAPGGTVELREAESGRLRAVLSIGSLNSAVTMAAISRDGRTVAAGTEDGVICVWDVSPFTAPRR